MNAINKMQKTRNLDELKKVTKRDFPPARDVAAMMVNQAAKFAKGHPTEHTESTNFSRKSLIKYRI